jgi:hypothetical protein
MIAIDFAPGLHGNFLEFVINRYIFDVPYSVDSIFQKSGAAHIINQDPVYQQHKKTYWGHFSAYGDSYPESVNKVIWIKHNPKLDFVLLTNIFYRCHPNAVSQNDTSIVDQKKFHTDLMGPSFWSQAETGSLKSLRMNWYTKFQERHFSETEKYPNTTIPVHEFDYSSFFSLPEFIIELQRVSEFLNITLKYDTSLGKLWQEFALINQGFNNYKQAQQILANTLSNVLSPIDVDDWQLQAWLNHNLSKMFRLYDGELFDNEQYVDNTQSLYALIQQHLIDFDSKF